MVAGVSLKAVAVAALPVLPLARRLVILVAARRRAALAGLALALGAEAERPESNSTPESNSEREMSNGMPIAMIIDM
jgi:hypothetical protein